MHNYQEVFKRAAERIKRISSGAKEKLESAWKKLDHPRRKTMDADIRLPYMPVARRRDYQRYIINTKAAVTTFGNASREVILNNLCARGAGIISGFPLEAKSIIKITFNAPKIFSATVTKNAQVAWCNRVGDDLWQAGMDFGLDNLLDMRTW